MALMHSSETSLGWVAPDFSLPTVSGSLISLSSFQDAKALLIVFMCNHCPYVIAVQDRINDIAKKHFASGLRVLGISSNDPNYKEEDSFENMKLHSKKYGFVFPYAFDESQNVAKAYDAVCTPDPYLFVPKSGQFELVYRGRIDDSWKDPSLVRERSIEMAIERAMNGESPLAAQIPSMGCSIKWKANR